MKYETFEQWETSPVVNEIKEWLLEKETLRPGYAQAVLNIAMALGKIANIEDEADREMRVKLLGRTCATMIPVLFEGVTLDQLTEDVEYLSDKIYKSAEALPEGAVEAHEKGELPSMTIPEKFKGIVMPPNKTMQ